MYVLDWTSYHKDYDVVSYVNQSWLNASNNDFKQWMMSKMQIKTKSQKKDEEQEQHKVHEEAPAPTHSSC